MYQEKRAFELLEKLAFVRTAGTRQEAQAAQILAALRHRLCRLKFRMRRNRGLR